MSTPMPEYVRDIGRRLGARVRELRLDAEMSQAELGRRTGIHRPIICRIERGVHLLSFETIVRVAAGLEVDVGTLCCVLDDEWCRGARNAALWSRQLLVIRGAA